MKEEILVSQLKNGSYEAFDLLYEKYKNLALRTAYLITGNLSESEDITQETFVKVYLHIDELKNESGFKPWMMQILVRTAYRAGRKAKKEIPDDEMACSLENRTVISPLGQMIKQEEAEMIFQAVKALPEKQRTVIILYYYNEFSIGEIAEILGCREGTVKSRLHLARKSLRKKLDLQEWGYHFSEEFQTGMKKETGNGRIFRR